MAWGKLVWFILLGFPCNFGDPGALIQTDWGQTKIVRILQGGLIIGWNHVHVLSDAVCMFEESRTEAKVQKENLHLLIFAWLFLMCFALQIYQAFPPSEGVPAGGCGSKGQAHAQGTGSRSTV